MGKVAIALAHCFAIFTLPMLYEEINEWLYKVISPKEKVSKLYFYIHNYATGPNSSAVTVAKAMKRSDDESSPTPFGEVFVRIMNHPLTEGPELTLRRTHGLYDISGTGRQDMSLVTVLNKDSSFAFLGRVAPSYLMNEMPIFGGTDIFRLA